MIKSIFSKPYIFTKSILLVSALVVISGLLVKIIDPHLNQVSSSFVYLLFYPYIFADFFSSSFYFSLGSLLGFDVEHSFLINCSGSMFTICFSSFGGVILMLAVILLVIFLLETFFRKIFAFEK